MSTARFILLALWIAIPVSPTDAQDPNVAKGSDTPAGTWRWEHQLNGQTIKDTLYLELVNDKKVTGKYVGPTIEVPVRNGKFSDDKLTFDFDAELGQTITFLFEGKIDEDQIDGKVTAKTDDGERDFPWKPKRSVTPSDVVGKWTFEIVTPDEEKLTPTLAVKLDGGKLSGVYSHRGNDITAENLEVRDNELVFDIVTELNGQRLDVSFTGRPYGNTQSGILNFAINGNTGDLKFTAKREAIKPAARKQPDTLKKKADVSKARTRALRTTGLVNQLNSPRFRGVGGTGVYADDERLPDTWSDSENVAWSTDVPGLGWACPVIWGDKVFIATVVADSDDITKPKQGLYLGKGVRDPAKGVHHWMVYCYDLNSGKEIWKHEAHSGEPKVPRHPKSTYAAETPVTDGERLYVLFGDLGLYCYDLNGQPLWHREIAPEKTFMDYGAAASPIVHKDHVIVVYDNLGQSWIASFDAKTGNENWRTDRDESHSWATPLIWQHDQRTEIVVNGRVKNRSYSLDGKLLWEFDGRMSGLVIPSPFVAHGMCYIASGYVGDAHRPTFAVKPGASGDITPEGDDFSESEFIAWYRPTASSYNPTQIVYGDYLYTLYDRGFMTCHDAKTGESIYTKKRFSPGGSFTASPWAYNGKIFCLSEEGRTYVIQAGPEFKILNTNELNELALSCPAVVDGKLLIRTASKLYCITR